MEGRIYNIRHFPWGNFFKKYFLFLLKKISLFIWSTMVLLKYKQFKVSQESRLLVRKGLETNDNTII